MRSEPLRAMTEQYSRSTLEKETLHGTNSPWLLELKADHKQSPRAGVRLHHILAWSIRSWQLFLNAWQHDEPAVHRCKQPRVVDPRPGSAHLKRAFYPTTNQWHDSGACHWSCSVGPYSKDEPACESIHDRHVKGNQQCYQKSQPTVWQIGQLGIQHQMYCQN